MKVLLSVFVYLVLLKVFLEPLFPFLISILIFIILRPCITFFSHLVHVKKNIIGFIVLFLFFICILLFCVYGLYQGYDYINSHLHLLTMNMNEIEDLYVIVSYLADVIWKILSYVMSSIPSVLFCLMIMCLSSFYLVIEQEYIQNIILHFTDLHTYMMIKKCFMICNKTIIEYCKIQTIIMFFNFIVLLFITNVLDLSFAFLFSFLLALLDCFPILGIGIGLIPLMLYYLFEKFYLKCLYIFLVFLFLTLMRSLIEMHMMKKTMKIPSFLILLSMIIHVYIYGVAGIVLSVLHMNIVLGYLEYRKLYEEMI